jgi:hypothetical protein
MILTAPVDPKRFLDDFVKLLDRRVPRPFYPDRHWWRALQIADLRDQFRSVERDNARDDASYYERQQTYLLRESNSAWELRWKGKLVIPR